MTDRLIYPSGKCFDDALEFLNELAKLRHPAIQDDSLVLVHAICEHPDVGHKFAHAWVEDRRTERVIFKGVLDGEEQYFATSKSDHYAEIKVFESVAYTPQQAVLENVRSGTFGPWIDSYKALCRLERQNDIHLD